MIGDFLFKLFLIEASNFNWQVFLTFFKKTWDQMSLMFFHVHLFLFDNI